MSIASVRRMASDILKAGVSRIKYDPSKLADIEKAITKDDVRALIKQKAVKVEQKKGVSRALGRMHDEERRKGRAHKFARRRGTHSARAGGKRVWLNRIRAQRTLIKSLKTKGMFLSNAAYRETYLKVKGGAFPDKTRVLMFLNEKGFIKAKETKSKK